MQQLKSNRNLFIITAIVRWSFCLSVCLTFYPSIDLLYMYLSAHPPIHLSIHPCIHPLVCPSIYLSVHPFIHLPTLPPTYISIHLSIHPLSYQLIYNHWAIYVWLFVLLFIHSIHPSIYSFVHPSNFCYYYNQHSLCYGQSNNNLLICIGLDIHLWKSIYLHPARP